MKNEIRVILFKSWDETKGVPLLARALFSISCYAEVEFTIENTLSLIEFPVQSSTRRKG